MLAKNFGVSASEFADLPTDIDHTRYMFPVPVPGPLSSDRVADPSNTEGQLNFSYRLLQQAPLQTEGGRVRIVDSRTFPAASTIAAALVEIEPGRMRELHWHPTNGEWQYYIENTGETTLRFLEMFKSPRFADVSLNQWMALTPPELVQAHLNLSPTMMAALHKQKRPIV